MTANSSSTLRGGLLLISAMSVIGLIDNFIRFIAADAGVWQFFLFRAVMACLIISGYLAWRKRTLRPQRLRWVALRSVLMASAILIYFVAVSFMPISIAGATLFASPIFLLLFSVVLFRIRVGIWRIAAVMFGFIGIVLVLKPNPQALDVFALVPAMAGMMYAMAQLVTRHKCAGEDTVVMLFGFFFATGLLGVLGLIALSLVPALGSLSAAVPFLGTGWVMPTGEFLLWTAVQAIGSLIAVVWLIRAYQIAEPTYVAVFEYSFIVFAGFWGWVFWNEVPDGVSLAGIATIVIAGAIITIRSSETKKI